MAKAGVMSLAGIVVAKRPPRKTNTDRICQLSYTELGNKFTKLFIDT
jgi:hypothetical protein